MTSAVESFDLAIIGGGPAGCISALQLKKQGLNVVLFDADKSEQRLEGMGNRLMQWFANNNLASVIPNPRQANRVASWNGVSNRYNFEFLVERKSMDAALREHVCKQNIVVVRETATYRQSSQAVVVTSSSGAKYRVRRLIDARGRKAHSGRQSIHGPATVAIGGWINKRNQETASTQIIPFRQGWVWVANAGDDQVWLQATLDAIDGKKTPIERLQHALELCRKQLNISLTGEFDKIVVRGCAPVIGDFDWDSQILPVGDAAAAMDPLSGNGIFWAVSSALAVSTSINTLERCPGRGSETLVRQYLRERIRENYYRQARLGRDFLRMESRFREAPFWAKRLDFPDNKPLHQPVDGIKIKKSIAVEDGILKEKEILITSLEPSGVAWVDGIEATQIWSLYQAEGGLATMSALWGEDRARAFRSWIETRLTASPVTPGDR